MSSLSPKRRSAASATTRPPPPPTFAHLRPVLRGYTTDTDRLIHGWLCGDRERSRRLVPRVLCAGLRAASFVDGALQHGLDVVPLALVGRVATIRVEEADDRRDVSPTVERVPGDVLPPTSEQLGRVQAVVEQIDRQSPTTPHPRHPLHPGNSSRPLTAALLCWWPLRRRRVGRRSGCFRRFFEVSHYPCGSALLLGIGFVRTGLVRVSGHCSAIPAIGDRQTALLTA